VVLLLNQLTNLQTVNLPHRAKRANGRRSNSATLTTEKVHLRFISRLCPIYHLQVVPCLWGMTWRISV